MKYLPTLLLIGSFLLITGCSSEPEENTQLSDYKKRQLDKAKEVEKEMNKRVDNINQQLEESTQKKDDDTQ